jgi:hypothetical protein
MIPRHPDHSQPEPPKDPEIQGWFQALGPPPVAQVSPALHAQVRARIAQQQVPWRLGVWLPRLVLAGVLALSLGLNLWWGHQVLGPQGAEVRSSSTSGQERAAAAPLRTYRFQREIAHPHGVGAFVEAHPAWQAPPALATFTPYAARTLFVRLGVLYAEACATLASGDVAATRPRLDLLGQLLESVQAPPTLSRYLDQLRTALQHPQAPPEDRALALFEPLYAAAGDPAALQRGGGAVEEVRNLFTALGVPPQVLTALERLQRLVRQPTLTAGDMHVIRTLAQEIQEQVST